MWLSNLDQTPLADRHKLQSAGVGVGHKASRSVGEYVMTKADELREYAEIDPKDYRAYAAQCIEMANNASGDVSEQNILFEMAQTWLGLAAQAERAAVRKALTGSASPAQSRDRTRDRPSLAPGSPIVFWLSDRLARARRRLWPSEVRSRRT